MTVRAVSGPCPWAQAGYCGQRARCRGDPKSQHREHGTNTNSADRAPKLLSCSQCPEGVTRARAPDAHERGGTDFWQAMASLSWTKVTFYASFQQNAPVLPPWALGKQGRRLIGPVTLLNAQGRPDLHRYRNQAHSPDFALDSSVITSQS